MCEFIDAIEDKNDLWIIFEYINNAKPVFGSLSDLQGSFLNGDRIYEIIQNEQTMAIMESGN